MHGIVRSSVVELLLLNSAQFRSATSSETSPVVKLETSTLEGADFGPKPNELAFLGVPFASPPTGVRHWKPPLAVPEQTGTPKAVTFGSPCAQLPAQ
jgi:carboxylesterase type B